MEMFESVAKGSLFCGLIVGPPLAGSASDAVAAEAESFAFAFGFAFAAVDEGDEDGLGGVAGAVAVLSRGLKSNLMYSLRTARLLVAEAVR